MKNVGFGEKLRYKFDNIMSKGTIALIGILFLATVIVIVMAGLLAFVLGEGPIGENIWQSIMHTIDAGTIVGTDTSRPVFLVLMCIVTLGGIFITSILIGIITTGFEEKLNTLKKGNSRVIEKNHVVILGFNDNIGTIISELVAAGENQKDNCIVVLAEGDKEEVEEAIGNLVEDLKTTRLICRTGSITDLHMLKQCAIETSRAVIINERTDFITTKAILAINNYIRSLDAPSDIKTHIVAMVSDTANYEAIQIAGENLAELILVHDSVARIIAQTCRQPGLSNVLIDLFDFSGSELYFENFAELQGKTFQDVLTRFNHSIVFGYKRGKDIFLNPPKDTVMEQNDKVLILVEDDGMAKFLPNAYDNAQVENLICQQGAEKQLENVLILGANSMLSTILHELDNYYVKGSRIIVANDTDEYLKADIKLENIELKTIVCDIGNRKALEALTSQDISHVLLLSNDSLDTETTDAKTLLKLIHLRDIAQKTNRNFNITSEMENTTNQKLAQVAQVNDLVVGSNIINLMMAQIAENRDLAKVFQELLHVDGSEIYIRNAENYVKLNEKLDFFDVTEIVARRNEIAVGYKKRVGNSYEIIVNPTKSDSITFTEGDSIVLLASD